MHIPSRLAIRYFTVFLWNTRRCFTATLWNMIAQCCILKQRYKSSALFIGTSEFKHPLTSSHQPPIVHNHWKSSIKGLNSFTSVLLIRSDNHQVLLLETLNFFPFIFTWVCFVDSFFVGDWTNSQLRVESRSIKVGSPSG